MTGFQSGVPGQELFSAGTKRRIAPISYKSDASGGDAEYVERGKPGLLP
jgi:hypothetical protein